MDSLLRETQASFDLYEFLSRTYDTNEYGRNEKKEEKPEKTSEEMEKRPEKSPEEKKEKTDRMPESGKTEPEKEKKKKEEPETVIGQAIESIREHIDRETAGKKQIKKRMNRKEIVAEGQMSIFAFLGEDGEPEAPRKSEQKEKGR